MMDLQTTRDKNEPELEDMLRGCRHLVRRIDELHASPFNDSEYVFIIWATEEHKGDELFERLEQNSGPNATVKQLGLGIYSWSEVI